MEINNFWTGKRVFITGATGLVGNWLTKALLKKGAYVVVLIRDWDPQSELIRSQTIFQTQVINGCLENYSHLERAINENEIDTVFHLGAQTIVGTARRNPLPTFEANIRGSYHLLEACRVHKQMVKRIVVASSDKAYGEAEHLPYTEAMPLNGRHPYDVSKSCTDLLAHTYFHSYDLPLVIARCGNIYGGGDLNWSRLIPGTIRSYYQEKRPMIRSNGKLTRDFVYVQDAVEAYLMMAEALDRREIQGEAFNFSPSAPFTVLEIIAHLQKLMGKEHLPPIIQNCASGEIPDQCLSSDKAKRLLNWSPTFTLEEGLKETIQWYLDYFHINTPQYAEIS